LTPWTCLSKIKKTIVYISREVQAQNQDQNASNAHSSTKTTQQQKASQKSLNQLDPSTRKQIQGIMNPFQQIKKLQQIQVAKRQEIIRQEIEEIVNNKQHSEDVNYRQTQQPYQQSVKKLVHVFRKSKPPNIIPKLGTHTAEEEKNKFAKEYYQQLYKIKYPTKCNARTQSQYIDKTNFQGQILTDIQQNELSQQLMKKEVKQAIQQLHSYKAPGPDGIPAEA